MIRYQNSLVVCARWENETIAEWLVYHRSIGFDHVYLYCNDDDPHALHAAILPFKIGPDPFVTFLHHSIQGDQSGMYKHFLHTYRHETERFMFLDVDEFLCMRGVDNIRDFIRNGFENCDDLYFNWVWFGNSGYEDKPPGWVLTNYTRRSNGVFILTKHLVRSSVFDRQIDIDSLDGPFHHALTTAGAGGISRLSVLGEDYSQFLELSLPQKGAYLNEHNRAERMIATGCIFHYAFKSTKDLLRRASRGTGGSFAGQDSWKTLYESGDVEGFFAPLNAVQETYLKSYWQTLLDQADATLSAARLSAATNIAGYGIAEQSSVSEWSRGKTASEDAFGAISGTLTGRYQFHTALEDRPWWLLIFPADVTVERIRIYNRLDMPRRANGLQVSAQTRNGSWVDLARWTADQPFGGADGQPFEIVFQPSMTVNAIRLQIDRRDCLHLDQVEVLGSVPPSLSDRKAA